VDLLRKSGVYWVQRRLAAPLAAILAVGEARLVRDVALLAGPRGKEVRALDRAPGRKEIDASKGFELRRLVGSVTYSVQRPRLGDVADLMRTLAPVSALMLPYDAPG